jgi:uncharacterized protein YndB with AHSA1/START domain
MATIRHRIGIAAPAARVYEAFATKEGLASWWTPTVEGDANLGGTLRFYFGGPEPGAIMEVAELVPNQRVTWRCVAGAEEWIGTTITFDLTATGDETVVLFTHADWREPVEFMYDCNTQWAYFLLGLKAGLEGTQAVA